MSFKKLSLALAMSGAALVACSKEEPAPAPVAAKTMPAAAPISIAAASPAGVAGEMGQLAKRSDIKGLARLLLPPEHYNKAVKEWDDKRKIALTEKDRQEFIEGWGKLIAPGAVDEIMKEAEPQLVQMKGQIPMYVAMGAGFAQQTIQADEKMTPAQKEQASALLNALQGWAMKTDFADAARLRKALTEFSNGARATKIATLDDLHALNFEQVLDKGGVMFTAFKRALNAYDLNMDEMFSTIKSEQLSMAGDLAKVKTTFQFLGQTITAENELVKVDGKWYGKDMLEGLEKREAEALVEANAPSDATDDQAAEGENLGAGN